MKVLVATTIGPRFEEFLSDLHDSFPGVLFQVANTRREQMQHVQDTDIFLGFPESEVLKKASRLRWVHVPWTGIEKVWSAPEFVDSDVVLTNSRGPHANPMADHVFGMILALAHRFPALWEDQKARRWEPGKYDERYTELHGRTMGILALGGIGRAVACRANGFGMTVYGIDIRSMSAPQGVKEVWGVERLDDLLRISDWLVVTAPITPATRGLVDRRRLGLLRPSSYIIVISRGGIVDEKALTEFLSAKRIAGAGLDAFETEPLPKDSPLWGMDNVVLSPHASALTPEMWAGRREIFKENLRRFLAGEPLLYVCDKYEGF